jgi:outer membrane immunogenic protein
MKKIMAIAAIAALLGTPALAADMDVKAPAPPPPPAWSWTGFYVGLQGGDGWGTTTFNATSSNICFTAAPSICAFPPPGLPGGNSAISSYNIDGWHGGGTAGFNWQNGPVVFGVEGDISGANINGNGDCTNAMPGNNLAAPPATLTGCRTSMTWFGTLTGRLGITVDHALIYVKGGGADAHFNYTATSTSPNIVPIAAPPAITFGENRLGGTAGFGVEYAFWNNWSAKLEYDYMDFGTKSFTFVGTPCDGTPVLTCIDNESVRQTVQVVRAGVNYRFNNWQ